MSKTTERSIVAIGVDEESLARISPHLEQQALELEGTVTTASASDLCSQIAFDLVLVRDPLAGLVLNDFLRQLSRPESASHRGRVVIIADDPTHPRLDEARQRSLTVIPASPTTLDDFARRVLRVEPRVDLRVLVRLELGSDEGTTVRMCQSANVSASGMLIHTAERLRKWSRGRLEFQLPDSTKPIRAKFEVVRHSTPGEIIGVAIRYLSMEQDDAERLRDQVGALLVDSTPRR